MGLGLREPAVGRVALLWVWLVQVGQQLCHLPLRRPLAVHQLLSLLQARQQEPKSRQQVPVSVWLLRLQVQAVERSCCLLQAAAPVHLPLVAAKPVRPLHLAAPAAAGVAAADDL